MIEKGKKTLSTLSEPKVKAIEATRPASTRVQDPGPTQGPQPKAHRLTRASAWKSAPVSQLPSRLDLPSDALGRARTKGGALGGSQTSIQTRQASQRSDSKQ